MRQPSRRARWFPHIFPPATDKPPVSRFFEQAASLLEAAETAAESGQPTSDWTIVVAREGGIRMLAGGSDWSLEALEQEHAARMVYRICRQRGAIRVEGRAGARTCLFQAAKPNGAARILPADEKRYTLITPAT